MPLLINLRHLENKPLVVNGELAAADLELEKIDDLVHVSEPVRYDLTAEKIEKGVLVTGEINVTLECECVRCLKRFNRALAFPEWICHLPLDGEEEVEVINDCVDLTQPIREDILLAFPQHPLCETGCQGLPAGSAAKVKKASGKGKFEEKSSPWTALDKLKL